ncbi:MAG: translesion error-prone DNA polymerase V autoproteolytic subunit [Desulfobulbus sp.]|nr:translesion error-prone DNA polymerase V autoproteolytic subunit [Desulfobulbus sp.]
MDSSTHSEQTTISVSPLKAQPKPEKETASLLPFFLSPVAAGFPSPAEDYRGQDLNLHEFLIHNPAATFFARANGDSMINAGIQDGDLLVIDRSLPAENGAVVIAAVAGELTVKRLVRKNNRVLLMPANRQFEDIDLPALKTP